MPERDQLDHDRPYSAQPGSAQQGTPHGPLPCLWVGVHRRVCRGRGSWISRRWWRR